MTDEPKRKLMVGNHPVSPFGRTEAIFDDEYWEEKAKRLQDERDTLTAALREARERETMLTAERDALRRGICDAEDALSLSRYQSAAVILDRAIPQAALAATPPPTDPPRYPHDALTAAAVPGVREHKPHPTERAASNLAMMMLVDSLNKGNTVEIPSLGITLTKNDLRADLRTDDALPTAPPTGSGEMEETKQ